MKSVNRDRCCSLGTRAGPSVLMSRRTFDVLKSAESGFFAFFSFGDVAVGMEVLCGTVKFSLLGEFAATTIFSAPVNVRT